MGARLCRILGTSFARLKKHSCNICDQEAVHSILILSDYRSRIVGVRNEARRRRDDASSSTCSRTGKASATFHSRGERLRCRLTTMTANGIASMRSASEMNARYSLASTLISREFLPCFRSCSHRGSQMHVSRINAVFCARRTGSKDHIGTGMIVNPPAIVRTAC